MAKIGKSIRVAPEVYSYIEKFSGEGFNEKFENIIIFAMKTEKDRRDTIKNLERQINDKNTQLKKLVDEINKLQNVSYRINDVMRSMSDIESKLGIKQQ